MLDIFVAFAFGIIVCIICFLIPWKSLLLPNHRCGSCGAAIDETTAVRMGDTLFHYTCWTKEKVKPPIGTCISCKKDILSYERWLPFGKDIKVHDKCCICSDCHTGRKETPMFRIGTSFYHETCRFYTCTICERPCSLIDSIRITLPPCHAKCACEICRLKPGPNRVHRKNLCNECAAPFKCSREGCIKFAKFDPIKASCGHYFCSPECRKKPVEPTKPVESNDIKVKY